MSISPSTCPRWGVSTLGDPAASLDEWMDLCAKWGFSEIELRVLDGSQDLEGTLTRHFGSPAGFAKAVQNRPARIAVMSASLRLANENPDHRAEFLSYAAWAEAAGVPWLRVFDKCGPQVSWTDEEWAVAARQFRWLREQREQNKWKADIIIEAHNAFFNPRTYERFCEMIGEEPPIIFDIGHAVRGLGVEGAFDAWREMAPLAPRVHFKDVAPPNPDGVKHCLPGHGIVPLKDFYKVLSESAPQPVVVFEWERFWQPKLPSLHEALEALQSLLSAPTPFKS